MHRADVAIVRNFYIVVGDVTPMSFIHSKTGHVFYATSDELDGGAVLL